MKKIFILLASFLLMCFTVSGQNRLPEEIAQVRRRMDVRDSLIFVIKSPKVKIDSLLSQVADANLCASLFEQENRVIRDSLSMAVSELDHYRLLMTTDTTVFHLSFAQMPVPVCLESHVALIKKISALRNSIESLEGRVDNLKKTIQRANLKEVIAEEIEEEIQRLNAMIVDIKNSDQSSLSDEQKSYFKPGLTERYNNFSIYFE